MVSPHKHKSELAGQALRFIAGLYEIEREVRDAEPEICLEARQQRARPILDALHLEGLPEFVKFSPNI